MRLRGAQTRVRIEPCARDVPIAGDDDGALCVELARAKEHALLKASFEGMTIAMHHSELVIEVRLGVRPESVVGVGDAENDHAFLSMCGRSIAVGNALQAVKERAHFTTEGTHGAGVVQLIERWLTVGLDDLVTERR